jgi:NAD(P)H-dependent FMN reductase
MKLQVIVGSTRPGRITLRIAKWVVASAEEMPDVEVELVDLADYNMPFLDEAISPRYNPNRTPNPEAKRWLDKLAQADAFVIVTPEYNRSYSAVLKNAIDYVDFQMERKPVALVGHGATGGAQAIAHLRGVLPGIHAATVPAATFIMRATDIFDEEGHLSEEAKANPYGPHTALKQTLDSTRWYSDALATARAKA